MVEPGIKLTSRFEPRTARAFAWLAERMVRRAFAAMRLERGSIDAARALAAHDGGAMLLVNHPAWWDPLVVAVLWRRFFSDRTLAAPMDAGELRRFRIFTRLGVFGLDPDDPRSAAMLLGTASRRWREAPRTLLVVTPQGRFTDPRDPVELRPGAAIVASRHAGLAVAAVAVEYVFWTRRTPEILLRIRRVEAPGEAAPRAWLDTMSRAMEENGQALASLSRARDERAFETLVDGTAPSGPYALWLRMTRRGAEIDAHRRREGGS